MESLNRMATDLVDEAIDFADELGVVVHHLDNDAAVLDFGVEAPGGIEAGLLLAEIQTGGVATVSARMGAVGGSPRTHVELATDHPRLALLASGKAGWELEAIGGRGSGPARLFVPDGPEFDDLDYEEAFDFAVLAVEAERLPDEAVASSIADRAGVPPSGLFLPTAPAASIAGSVSIAARAAEVALLRLSVVGYDPGLVRSVVASAPVAPVAADERAAIARANDAIAHGGRAHLVVERPVEDVDALVFAGTGDEGRSFSDLLPAADWNLSDLEDAFAPAAVTVDVVGGPTATAGGIDDDRLADLLHRCG